MKGFDVLSPQRSLTIDLGLMIDSRVLLSLVLWVGDAFRAFGTANKGLAWQQVAIKPGTSMAVLAWSWNVCAIF